MKKVTILIAIMVCMVACREKAPYKTGLEGKVLPKFQMQLMDGEQVFSSDNIQSGRPFVLFLFSPLCPYCRMQLKQITGDSEQLEAMDIYILANGSLADIKAVTEEFQLGQYKNLTIGRENGDMTDYFQPPGVPFLAVYNSENKLNVCFLGNTKSGDILKMTNN